MGQNSMSKAALVGVALCAAMLGTQAATAAPIYWTDWTTSSGAGGFTANGTMTTPTSTVNVTYNNPLGVGFYQSSGGTDYWVNTDGSGKNSAASPYTSTLVDNAPTGTDIIALHRAGNQTLTFSEAIANPVFSYVSLNGNGYAFLNQDFEILSFGHSTSPGGPNSIGYWGSGTSYKNVVDLGGGNFEYQLLGTGEPHGTIRFTGAFSSVTWRSLSNEYWNGFTVGVQGTADEVFVPEPASLTLCGVGIFGLGFVARRRRSKQPRA